jgi:hypothetical protein
MGVLYGIIGIATGMTVTRVAMTGMIGVAFERAITHGKMRGTRTWIEWV